MRVEEKSLTRAAQREPERAEPSLERQEDGQLWVVRGRRRVAARVRPCFPWSQPTRFVSLRDLVLSYGDDGED